MLVSFLIASLICLALIIAGVVIFYEILAHLWLLLPKFEGKPRSQILLTILATFIGHTAVIWLFGITYYVLASYTQFGMLGGVEEHHLLNYIYFSGVTYSSLGLGDVYPKGDMRLMIAVEAILGLVLIGWTITITYFATEKYLIHKRDKHGKKHS
ncbi:MAG: two pore domain potassium channel family protein [Alphaproteobacteria bacterium]|nr:two pore domain potassium channel family protein [Alphaproteobacteria bacterium]